MPKAKGFFEASRFMSAVTELIESLPSEADKHQLEGSFLQLISFLEEVRGKLSLLPTREEAANTRSAISVIEDLILNSKQNPTLNAALGMKAAAGRRKPAGISAEAASRAKDEAAGLEALSVDEMRRRLADDSRYSAQDLRAIARHLGIRVQEKTGRDTLVHQISTRISNFRGYKDLAHGDRSTSERGQTSESSENTKGE